MQNQCNYERGNYTSMSRSYRSEEIKILKACVSNTDVKINNQESDCIRAELKGQRKAGSEHSRVYRIIRCRGRGRGVIIALGVIVEGASLPHGGRLRRLSVISWFFGRTGVNIESGPPSHFNIVSSRSIIITEYTRLSCPDADTSDVL